MVIQNSKFKIVLIQCTAVLRQLLSLCSIRSSRFEVVLSSRHKQVFKLVHLVDRLADSVNLLHLVSWSEFSGRCRTLSDG